MNRPYLSPRSMRHALLPISLLCALSPNAIVVRAAVSAPQASGGTLAGNLLPGLPAGAREPQVAIDSNGGVYIAFGAGDDLYCSASRDSGKSYAAPVRIASAGKLSLGMRRGPRVALSGKTVVVSAIYGKEGHGQDGELLAWRSADGGRTWRGPARVSDAPGAAREGLHAMAASPDGKTVACTWLDMRGKGTEIFLSRSLDGGATWSKNVHVYSSPDGTVCECCHPSIAFGGRGKVLVMWRNWLGGARDMYLATSADSGKTFSPARKLGKGTWPLNACPMDGGALAVAPAGRVTTVWRRDREMFVCEPGGAEKLLGRGQQGWVAATERGVYPVWLSAGSGQLMTLLPGESTARSLSLRASNPAIAAGRSARGPVVVTWSEGTSADSRIRSVDLAAIPTKR